MLNPIQKFRQSSIVFEKPGLLSEKLKTLTSSNYHTVQYFCWNFTHLSYLPMSTKTCSRFFILFRSCVIWKNQTDLVSAHSLFTFLLINQDLSKIKKHSAKILSFMVVGACQNFQFFRQITWFLGNDRALSKFRYWI